MCISLWGEKKNALLVLNHITTILESQIYVTEFRKKEAIINKKVIEKEIKKLKIRKKSLEEKITDSSKEELNGNLNKDDVTNKDSIKSLLGNATKEFRSKNSLITEQLIRNIHLNIANELDNNENGKPGEYRPEGAFIDFDTIFLESSLIPYAMNKIIKQHQQRFSDIDLYNPLLEACKISAQIIKIHPFGDFNGRVSRILLNLILFHGGLPFNLVLRSNSRNKKKYIKSMQDYFRQQKLDSFIAFVCMSFLEQIEKVNENLIFAGIPPLEPSIISDEKKTKLLLSLNIYLKND